MKQSTVLGEALIPQGGGTMQLIQGKDDFTIVLRDIRGNLMSTRKHGSEDALGYLPCRQIANPDTAHVLIGGLGMGFTLAAALAELGENAQVTVAELVPEVVEWNQGILGDRAGRPLDDLRTNVIVADVIKLIAENKNTYNVIALDIDNGPEGFTTPGNSGLYSREGIMATLGALASGGVIAYWSATEDRTFHNRLNQCGMQVEKHRVHAHGRKGTRHVIYLASTG